MELRPVKVSSDIEEDIISEQIEGEKDISNRSNQNAESSINEEIVASGDHPGNSSSAASAPESKPFQQLRGHQPFGQRQHSSIGESI
jgi:hypothetical protein